MAQQPTHRRIWTPPRRKIWPPHDIGIGFGGKFSWTPAELSSLVAWYRPEDWHLTSGAIDTWYDSSGNGRNATQGSAANRPQPTAGVWAGGKKAADFTVAQTCLTSAAVDLTSKSGLTLAAVLQLYGSTAANFLTFGGKAVGGGAALYHSWYSPNQITQSSVQTNMRVTHSEPVLDDLTTIKALLVTLGLASPYHHLYRNNVEVTPLTTVIGGVPAGNFGNNTITLGAEPGSPPTYSMRGYIGEAVICSSEISSDDRANLQTHFARTWGL